MHFSTPAVTRCANTTSFKYRQKYKWIKKLCYLSSSSDFESNSFRNFKVLGDSGSSWAEVVPSELRGTEDLLSPGCGLGVFLLPSIWTFPELFIKIGNNWDVDLLARRCLDRCWWFVEADCKSSFDCPIFRKKFAIDFPIPLLWWTFPFSYIITKFNWVKMLNHTLKIKSMHQLFTLSISWPYVHLTVDQLDHQLMK